MTSESACRHFSGTMENPIKTGGLHTRMPADDGRVELNPPVEIRAEPLHGGRNPKGDMNNARVA